MIASPLVLKYLDVCLDGQFALPPHTTTTIQSPWRALTAAQAMVSTDNGSYVFGNRTRWNHGTQNMALLSDDGGAHFFRGGAVPAGVPGCRAPTAARWGTLLRWPPVPCCQQTSRAGWTRAS